jgi:hypothetical protein
LASDRETDSKSGKRLLRAAVHLPAQIYNTHSWHTRSTRLDVNSPRHALSRSPLVVCYQQRSAAVPRGMMATDFAMPVQPFTASPSQYTLYNTRSQQTSPINSATATPNNSSPTSPRAYAPPFLPAHTRQLRPPKSPLYVPAVLRPTDPPKKAVKPSPLTPPSSRHNSFDPFENARALSRRSTGESGKFDLSTTVETECSTEGLGKVTALPTREHWKVCFADSLAFW